MKFFSLAPQSDTHIPQEFLTHFSPEFARLGDGGAASLLRTPFRFARSKLATVFTAGEVLFDARRGKGAHTNLLSTIDDEHSKFDGFYWVGEEHNLQKALAWRTADCLAITMAATVGSELFCAIVHAGWRGFAGGIHLAALERLAHEATQRGVNQNAFFAELEVMVSPAIFGATYPCGSEVKSALERRWNALEDKLAPRRHPEFEAGCIDIQNTAAPRERDKVYPDLQLLACCDLLACGLSTESITVFRENTYGHPFLHSYRFACQTGADANQRIVTHLAPLSKISQIT